MSVVLLYLRGCDFLVVRTFAQNTWGLANSGFYSEFTSLEPRYLYRIRDPGLEGELTRGCKSEQPLAIIFSLVEQTRKISSCNQYPEGTFW